MKIHILCNDGSPIGVTLKDLWGEGRRGIGVGGSEYALLTLCEEWHKAGNEVVLFNNPMTPNGSPFEQRNLSEFSPSGDRDVLIIFRSPNIRSLDANGLKVWWSCDQYTVGSYSKFAPTVHKIVCISNFHANYFVQMYGIKNTEVIDIPIRVDDLNRVKNVERVPYRIIFTSVPDRGLGYLRLYWDAIKDRCPEVSLTITSDYRLWGVEERTGEFRPSWFYNKDVYYLGAVKREELIVEQLKAEVIAYPSIYDELFCVSIAEAQCSGVFPITSSSGALATTNMGIVIKGSPFDGTSFRDNFINALIAILNNSAHLAEERKEIQHKALERFHPKIILRQWEEKVFK